MYKKSSNGRRRQRPRAYSNQRNEELVPLWEQGPASDDPTAEEAKSAKSRFIAEAKSLHAKVIADPRFKDLQYEHFFQLLKLSAKTFGAKITTQKPSGPSHKAFSRHALLFTLTGKECKGA